MFFDIIPQIIYSGTVVNPQHFAKPNAGYNSETLIITFMVLVTIYYLILLFDGCGKIKSLKKFKKLEVEPVNEEIHDYFSLLSGI